jgi:dolichol-phosphate mannosyltransferase
VSREIDVSVVCAVGREVGDLVALHASAREVLERIGLSAEFLFVFDGPRPAAEAVVAGLDTGRFPVRALRMARGFGEAAALDLGFARVRGRRVITIPAHMQVDLRGIEPVLAKLDEGFDVVVTRREPRRDPLVNRLQSRAFHWLIGSATGETRFRDLTSGLRGMTASSARALELYGDMHRFIPLLAIRHGFRVTEVAVGQGPEDLGLRLFRPGVYVRRVLDVLNVLLLTRFTRKPFRFFGLIGLAVAAVGAAICVVLFVERLLGLTALTERPLLLLGVLLLILGVQLASIGLLAEIIIFHSSRVERPQSFEIERRRPTDRSADTGADLSVTGQRSEDTEP